MTTYTRGETVTCPICRRQVTATGHETQIRCHNKHRAVAMQPHQPADETSR